MGTRLISKSWTVDGVLTNVTTAKLSDPTGTYGVKRNDTSAVIVADGTAMTNSSTGVYDYSFTDVVGVAYTAYVEIVYGGATYHFEEDIAARTSLDVSLSADPNDYDLVRTEIARFIGTPESTWDDNTSADVDSAIRKGIEAVVHNVMSHQWSWLRPTYRFLTSDGQRRYTLPIDFEQFIGDIYFDGQEYGYSSITQLPSGRLDQMFGEYANTGVPTNYALETVAHDGMTEQQYQLALHPTPDGEYSLVGPYQVGPIRKMSATRPWFPGGPEQKELFIAACLAATEAKFLDIKGDKYESFQMLLTAAIGRDWRKAPRNLGQLGGRRRSSRDSYRWKLSTLYNDAQNM
jgi:hypothetical protein